jgi:hypothetical protein
VYSPDPCRRVGLALRYVEPHQRDPVSAHVIGLGPQADRHREMQIADRDVVFLVISAQPTGYPGDERVVKRATAAVGRLPHWH